MADELFDPVDTPPTTPGTHPTEGYPDPGYAIPTFVAASSAGALREQQRFLGVLYPEVVPGFDYVERDRMNETKRVFYEAVRIWNRMLFLMGTYPLAWGEGWLIEGDGIINFSHVYEYTATGTNPITITWEEGARGDARSLSLWPNSETRSAMQPGLMAMTVRDGSGGLAQVLDINHTSPTTAELTLDKALAHTGVAYVARDQNIIPYPILALWPAQADHVTPTQCKYAIESPFAMFSSFATANPTAAMAAGADGGWFCEKADDVATDLSEFQAQCRASVTCPNYTAIEQELVAAKDLTDFVLAAGPYIRQLSAGSGSYTNFVIGRTLWTSIGQALGLPITYRSLGLYLPSKVYSFFGALKYATGETDADGFKIFESWLSAQDRLEQASSDPDDAVGLFAAASSISTGDTAGGTTGSRGVVAVDARTPRHDLRRAIGIRRIGDVGLGTDKTTSGPGFASASRVLERSYASAPFTMPATLGVIPDTMTRLSFLVTPLTIGAFTAHATWELPRKGEAIQYPATRHDLEITGTVAANSITGDRLTVEFKLGEDTAYYSISSTFPNSVGTSTYDDGGNIVDPKLSFQSTNPASTRRVGDGQGKACPGYRIEFDHASVAGIGFAILAAEAYGGGVQAGATHPHASAIHIPQWLRDNHDHRDKLIIALEDGPGGEAMRALVAAGALISVSILSVTQGPVAPPTIDYTGAATGYAPIVQLCEDGSTSTLVEATDYLWDPGNGVVYFDTSGWGAGANRTVFIQGVFMDLLYAIPCEMTTAELALVERAMDGYKTGGTVLTSVSLDLVGYNTDTDTEFPTDFWPTPGYVPHVWDVTNPDFVPFSAGGLNYEWRWKATGSSPYQYGFTSAGPTPESQGLVIAAWNLQVHLVDPPGQPNPAEIQSAFIDIDITDPTRTYVEYSLPPLVFTETETTVVSNMRLAAYLLDFTDEPDNIVLEALDVSIAMGDLTEVDVGGVTHRRGTIDITELLIFAVTNRASLADSNKRIGLTLVGPNDITSPDAEEMLYQVLDDYELDAELTAAPAYNLNSHLINAWRMEYASFTLTTPRVQHKYSELKANAPDFLFGADTQIPAPDLMSGEALPDVGIVGEGRMSLPNIFAAAEGTVAQ